MSESPEFISEAQEIIETFSRQLVEIEGQLSEGDDYDPDLLNGAFRSVHTLKGLSSLSGVNEIVDFSHRLENTLDALRLGKLPLNKRALNLLFESIDLFSKLLRGVVEPEAVLSVDVAPFLARLARLSSDDVVETDDPLAWLDDSILGVLTEYEEHRLRENIRLGRRIFRVHSSFDLLTFDVGIESLKTKLKSFGEVITFLPSANSSSDDQIELDILVGSKQSIGEIADGVAEEGVTIEGLGTGERIVIAAKSAVESSRPQASKPAPEPVSAAPTPRVEVPPSGASRRRPPRVEQIDDDEFPDDETGLERGSSNEPSSRPAARSASAGGSGRGGGGDRDRHHDDDDGGEGGDDQVSLKSLSQTVRVDLRRLDQLMNLVGELALVHTNLDGVVDRMQRAQLANEHLREFQDQLRVMNRRLGLLQQGILEVRMVPLGQVFDKLARVVRKVGQKLEKEVRLVISGADTELDKLIVEELSDPLMHMINNAIDHGIETPAERLALGKPRAGRIALAAYQKGNRVVIELTDDGRGMDWRTIRDRAVQRGFLGRDEAPDISAAQAINLIFTPGFSTKQQATATSGRGVGMDVVKTNIARLSGMIDVASEPGRGSRFRVTLPITLAIIQALVIETAGQTFCIPLNSVLESIMVQREDIQTIEGHEVVTVRGRTLPLVHLARVFDLDVGPERRAYDRLYVVVVGLAQHRVGLVVDELRGQQDVVIKPIGKALRQVPGIAGATELGDNRTVLLLDVGTLVGEAVGGVEATVAGIGSGREGLGVFSTGDPSREGRDGRDGHNHGGWGDGY